MNDKVTELVEWVAQIIHLSQYAHRQPPWELSWENEKPIYKDACYRLAKQILSHPDLALIDREKQEPVFFTHQMLAIRDASFTVTEGRTTIDSHAFGDKVVNLVRDKYKKEGFVYSVIPLAEAIKEEKGQ